VSAAKLAVRHDFEPEGSRTLKSGRCLKTDERCQLAEQERSTIMPLIQLLEVLVVVGVLLWLVNRFIPMQGTIKSIFNGVVVIATVLWILNAFGLFQSLSRVHVGT
jgi:hypothetical protein